MQKNEIGQLTSNTKINSNELKTLRPEIMKLLEENRQKCLTLILATKYQKYWQQKQK